MPTASAGDPAARPYAEALFGIGLDEKQVEAFGDELDGFASVLRSDPQIREFFASYRITPEAKIAFLQKNLSGKASPMVVNFLKLLARRGRFSALDDIRTVFSGMLDEHLGRVRTRLTTPAAPTPAELDAVRGAVKAKLGKDAVIESVVRPELMGGFVLQVGDSVVDASLKTRLRNLQSRLQTAAAGDIQARADVLAKLS